MILTSAGLSDRGCVRSENQDRIFFDDALGLYVVCDGLGGRRRGDVAAELALNAVRQYVEHSRNSREVTWPYGYNLQISFAANRISTAAKLANRQVWKRSEESLEFLGMGTTVAAVLFEPGLAAVANVGDTRAYLLRDGSLEQISVDDTVTQRQRESELPSLRGGAAGAIRSVLTRVAGSHENLDVHLTEHPAEAGDVILLASDGLHAVISDGEIAELLRADSLDDGVSALIRAAKQAGAPDNVSAVVVRYQTED